MAHPRLFVTALILVALLAQGCSGTTEDDFDDCPPPMPLAAGSATIALSCVQVLTYRGNFYTTTCLKVHPSRVGRRLMPEHEAVALRGVHVDAAFLLKENEPCDEVAIAVEDPEEPFLDRRYPLPGVDLDDPWGVSLEVLPRRVEHGEDVSVRLRLDVRYAYATFIDLYRVGPPRGQEELVALLEARDGRLVTRRPSLGLLPPSSPSPRNRTSQRWRWHVPELRAGHYELRAELVRKPLLRDPGPEVEATAAFTVGWGGGLPPPGPSSAGPYHVLLTDTAVQLAGWRKEGLGGGGARGTRSGWGRCFPCLVH